jgi:hypothetical protein
LQNEPTGVSNLVNGGVLAGEYAGVGRRGERALRYGVFEQYAAMCNAVQGGCLDLRIAVAAQAIRSERINGYDDYIERPKLLRLV